jgi:ABC-type phosphate transport system substrate-binding protein
MRKKYLLAFVLVGLLSCLVEAKQLAIVAEKSNATTNLSRAELVRIFLAKTHNWPDGKPVVVVVRDLSSADMQLVVRKVFNMTPAEAGVFVNAHRGMIVVADSDEAVIRFVSSTRGAIGVVDLFSLTKDVNVLKVDGKLPVEQGYLLRGD